MFPILKSLRISKPLSPTPKQPSLHQAQPSDRHLNGRFLSLAKTRFVSVASGTAGCNMKKIAEATKSKIRIRGQGSVLVLSERAGWFRFGPEFWGVWFVWCLIKIGKPWWLYLFVIQCGIQYLGVYKNHVHLICVWVRQVCVAKLPTIKSPTLRMPKMTWILCDCLHVVLDVVVLLCWFHIPYNFGGVWECQKSIILSCVLA